MVTVEQARNDQQIRVARDLFRAFVAWHRATHVEDLALIDRYFDRDAFEAELRDLPGAYAPPKGSLLVAFADGTPAGCVALRDLGEGDCEMKRMFVPTAWRGRGIGRRLADAVIADAQAGAYRRMRLDTGPRQAAAIALYESLGFHRIPPYYELPRELSDVLLFFERDL
jgi:ribosomal protein S18 acetylase RimI-like enzyme